MSRRANAKAPLEWSPLTRTTRPGICAFAVAMAEAAVLLDGVVHNANWANAHGIPFFLFRSSMIAKGLHHSWERVTAARLVLRTRNDCRWLMHMDADAVVVDVERSPSQLLLLLEAETASSDVRPVMFTTCNSPLGAGFDCDHFCCGRAKRRTGCAVATTDDGPHSPYPCMINPSVFLLRNSAAGRALLHAWEAQQAEQRETFGEQHSINVLQMRQPDQIEVVGGQVMNTHSSFHSRLLAERDPHLAYDIALRIASFYHPTIAMDRRLNRTAYMRAALSAYGSPLDFSAPHAASDELREKLQRGVGECIDDPKAFICHGFATRYESKKGLVRRVAATRRARLEQLLRRNQPGLGYRRLDEAKPLVLKMHGGAARGAAGGAGGGGGGGGGAAAGGGGAGSASTTFVDTTSNQTTTMARGGRHHPNRQHRGET